MISGVVRPNKVRPSARRASSTPATMLPHWSEPPICSSHSIAPGQLSEIVGLQDRVVEFEKAQGLVALEPQPDAVLGQHPVDREMTPDIAQQRDVAQLVEPIGIVDHDGVVRPVAELQELREDRADARHIAGDFGIVEQLSRLVLARRVADPRRAAAHQHDRLVPAALEEAQQHDRHQAADMQTVRRAVIADIGYNAARRATARRAPPCRCIDG